MVVYKSDFSHRSCRETLLPLSLFRKSDINIWLWADANPFFSHKSCGKTLLPPFLFRKSRKSDKSSMGRRKGAISVQTIRLGHMF